MMMMMMMINMKVSKMGCSWTLPQQNNSSTDALHGR